MIDQRMIDQADALIAKGEAVIRTATPTQTRQRDRGFTSAVTSQSRTEYGRWLEWRSQALSFLRRTLGEKDTYSEQFGERYVDSSVGGTEGGIGILRAVREDMANGNLARLPEIVRADVFSDFLEMAEHLLSAGYKDPAAVLTGGVLEEHLRLLCKKNGIAITSGAKPKKADTMNADLMNAGVYDANRLKIITAWLALRNSAAHADYGKYSGSDVERFAEGLREFIASHPA